MSLGKDEPIYRLNDMIAALDWVGCIALINRPRNVCGLFIPSGGKGGIKIEPGPSR